MGGNYGKKSHRNGSGRGRGGKRSFNSGGRDFNSRGRDNNRDFAPRGRGGDRDNNLSQWQTKDRLTEPEVGITQFISTVPGFQGIIKSRYSDFHVNELDLEGNEATLNSFALPEAPEEVVEDAEAGVETELKDFLTEEQLQKLEKLVKAKPNEAEPVVIDVTDYDKEKRAKLHHCLKAVHGKEIFNETVTEEEKKFIHVKKSTKSDQQRAHAWRWPAEFTCFVLHKENIDTLQAIATLSNELRMKPALFAYAGTKDKRAKTSQWISVRKMEPSRIANAAKRCQGVRVGNFKFIPETLRLGNLKGNRFRIALRSVKGEKEDIEKSLESIRDLGFINYYGLQRFGNCQKIPTNSIGKALLGSDFKTACELILQERDGEPYFMQKMRKCYSESKNAKKTLETLHSTNTSVEARLLHGMVKYGDTNFLQALLNLPRNMLMLYTHAYQSFMFNQIASKRRELGLEVVEGDLVFTEAPETEIVDILDDEAKGEEDEVNDLNAESKFQAMVRPLTKEDIDSKTFTIYDIVLPLPGYDIKYPSNEIGKIYLELLAKDDLSSEKLKSKHNVFSLTGAYRRVFVKPESFSWKFMKYQGATTDLILSDYSKIFNDPEPESDPNGENLALIIDFVLPPSSYATMALREIMKCDTSVGSQITLESEIKKAADEETDKKRALATQEEKDEEATEAKKMKTE